MNSILEILLFVTTSYQAYSLLKGKHFHIQAMAIHNQTMNVVAQKLEVNPLHEELNAIMSDVRAW